MIVPTYAYRCTECDHAFDIHQSFSDASLSVCPECGGKLRKVFGSLGVTFNGSGFYRTDSRAASSGGAGSSGATAGASSSGASSGKAALPSGGSGSSSS